MGPVLKGLIKLQSIENRLGAAKSKLKRCRRSIILQENKIRNLQSTQEAKKEELQLTRVQSDRLEMEVKSREENIAKYRAALNGAKTNKEYAAILTQLNTTKADNSKVENQLLDLMKDVETDEQECDQIRQEIEQEKESLEQIRKDAEEQSRGYQEEIDKIQAEWDAQASNIPADALDIFKRVAENYDGEALAVIEQADGGGAYSCGGCFMGITAESVNLLMTKDDIIRCPNCMRILVIEDSDK